MQNSSSPDAVRIETGLHRCYECGDYDVYLFSDARCYVCTRLTPEEVCGETTTYPNV